MILKFIKKLVSAIVLIAVAAVMASAGIAQAQAASPGSFLVYGTVSYNGVPTNNIEVVVNDTQANSLGAHEILGTARTDVNGAYQISLSNLQAGKGLTVFASLLPYYALQNITYNGTDQTLNVNLNIIPSEDSMISITVNGTVNDGNNQPQVSDTTAPVITILGANPASVNAGDVYDDAGAEAVDDADPAVNVMITGLPLDTTTAGQRTVVYTATDSSGNTATTTRTVIVQDIPIAKVLTSAAITPASPTVTVGGYQLLTVSSLDQFGSPIKTGITINWSSDNLSVANVVLYSNTVRAVSPGKATLMATITDGANTVTETVTVTVVLSLPMVDRVHVSPDIATTTIGGTIQFTAEARDANNAPLNPQPDVTWSMKNNDTTVGNINSQGLFTAAASGTASIMATMGNVSGTADVIIDITPPVITLYGNNPVIVTQGSEYIDEGAAAIDDVDSNLSAYIIATGNVNIAAIGNYTVTYNVSDAAGNQAAPVTRTVKVVPPPTLTIGNVSGLAGGVVAVPVQLSNNQAGLSAFNFDILYDEQILNAGALNASGGRDYVNRTGSLTANYDLFAVNTNTPGRIQIAAASLNPTATNGVLMRILFSIKTGASGNAIVNLSSPNDPGNDLRQAQVTAGTVTVTPPAGTNIAPTLTSLIVSPSNGKITTGSALKLRAKAYDQNGELLALQPTFSWFSSNNQIVSVDADGLATGLAVGTSTITVTSGLKSATAVVTVWAETKIEFLPQADWKMGLESQGALIPETDDDYASTTALTTTHEIFIKISSDQGQGQSEVNLPKGVKISDVEGKPIDGRNLTATTTKVSQLAGLATNFSAKGALKWGMDNKRLQFSQPITLKIFVGNELNGQTLNILRSPDGASGWTSEGIVAPGSCAVANGICSFQATKASVFAAAVQTAIQTQTPSTPTPASSGGGGGGGSSSSGGGGGGGGASVTPPALITATNTPLTIYPAQSGNPQTQSQVIEPAPQVLGVKTFAEGSLLRNRQKKIFVIKNGKLEPVRSLTELRTNYKGQMIFDADDETLKNFKVSAKVLGAITFKDGQLIRGKDKKIYVIKNGRRQLVKGPSELRNKYRGVPIKEVDDQTIKSISLALTDGLLVRDSDKRIWLVSNGQKVHIKTMEELRRFSGRVIINVSDEDLKQLTTTVAGSGQATVQQSTLMGTVVSVSGSQFIMKTDDKTISVALDAKGLMYIKKRGGRVAQSNLKPGHQVRVVTNDKIGSSVIKPLVIEDFSLPLP